MENNFFIDLFMFLHILKASQYDNTLLPLVLFSCFKWCFIFYEVLWYSHFTFLNSKMYLRMSAMLKRENSYFSNARLNVFYEQSNIKIHGFGDILITDLVVPFLFNCIAFCNVFHIWKSIILFSYLPAMVQKFMSTGYLYWLKRTFTVKGHLNVYRKIKFYRLLPLSASVI